MPIEILCSVRAKPTAEWIVKNTVLRHLRPQFVPHEERWLTGPTSEMDVLRSCDKPSIIVAHSNSSHGYYRLLFGLDVHSRSPMGQNSFQDFPRPVYCSLIGMPYVGMTPFANWVRKQTGKAALEKLSPLIFPAFNKLFEFSHIPATLVPWPGSEDYTDPRLKYDEDRLPDARSSTTQGFFQIINELFERLVIDHEDVTELSLESLVPWMRLLKDRSPSVLPPLERHSVSLVPTSHVGWHTGMNGFFDWVRSEETASRLDSVVFHTQSKTIRHYPYAGSALLWDMLLCRTGLASADRTRNLVIHFGSVGVDGFLGGMPNGVAVHELEPGLFGIRPEREANLRELLGLIPMDSRLFLQLGDALVFQDGWLLPTGFDVAKTALLKRSRIPALSRPVQSRYFVFTEGDDRPVLQRIARIIGDEQTLERPELEWRKIGGAENWRKVSGFPWSANALGEQVSPFLLLDRDYRSEGQVEEIRLQLQKVGVRCHIWCKKEIENYLVQPQALVESIRDELSRRTRPEASWPELPNLVLGVLDEALEEQRSHTFGQLLKGVVRDQRGKEESTVFGEFHASFDEDWKSLEYRMSRVSGKRLIASLNRLLQGRLGVTVSLDRILSHTPREAIDPEVLEVLDQVRSMLSSEDRSQAAVGQ